MRRGSIKTFIKGRPILLKIYRTLNQAKLFSSRKKKDIKGANNRLNFDSSVFSSGLEIKVFGDSNEVVVETSVMLKNVRFYVKGNNNRILIESGVEFRNGGLLWIEDDNCELRIGKKTTFNGYTHLAVTEPGSVISIGEDCMFAYNIDVRTGDSHSIIDVATNKRINYAKNVIIGEHVWVAAHVSILKGSTILRDSVVATRSVVTKSFQHSNVLIGGCPAKVLKEGITWDRSRIYET